MLHRIHLKIDNYNEMNKNATLSGFILVLKLLTTTIISSLRDCKYPEKKKQLEELANSLNENDNPVLMLVKLKE